MSSLRRYGTGVLWNWTGFVTNLVLTLVVSVLVKRSLGEVQWSLWTLLVSVVGYLGFVDLGLRPAIYREINWLIGRREQGGINAVVTTTLAFFGASIALLLIVSTVLGTFFDEIFPRIRQGHGAEELAGILPALVMMAASLGLTMLSAVFESIIETHQRFDLRNKVDIAVAILKAAGAYLALRLGAGLEGLAGSVLLGSAAACTCSYVLAKRVFPALKIERSSIRRSVLRQLFRMGVPFFISGVGLRIVLYTDALLITWMLDVSWVGYYSTAAMLFTYGRGIVERAASVFRPEIQQTVARGDKAALRHMVPLVTRVTVGFSALIVVGVVVFGPEFLGLLWGETARKVGTEVLPLLGVAFVGPLVNMTVRNMLAGAGRVKVLAGISLAEALLNVGLTILAVKVFKLGLSGVALGTMLPMVALSGVWVLLLGVRYLEMRLKGFLTPSLAGGAAAALLFGVVSGMLALGRRGVRIEDAPWAPFLGEVLLAVVLYAPIFWFLVCPKLYRERLVRLVLRR